MADAALDQEQLTGEAKQAWQRGFDLAHLEGAEARKDHAIAARQRLLYAVEDGVQRRFPLSAGPVQLARHPRAHVALPECCHWK